MTKENIQARYTHPRGAVFELVDDGGDLQWQSEQSPNVAIARAIVPPDEFAESDGDPVTFLMHKLKESLGGKGEIEILREQPGYLEPPEPDQDNQDATGDDSSEDVNAMSLTGDTPPTGDRVRLGWVRYEGDRGGAGWRNEETGEVRYQEEKPGERGKKKMNRTLAKKTNFLSRFSRY